jgi:hypothetical protein
MANRSDRRFPNLSWVHGQTGRWSDEAKARGFSIMARSKLTLQQEAGYMNATGCHIRAETLRTGLGPYMNPSD